MNPITYLLIENQESITQGIVDIVAQRWNGTKRWVVGERPKGSSNIIFRHRSYGSLAFACESVGVDPKSVRKSGNKTSVWDRPDHRNPTDVTGLTKICTVFGIRYAIPHSLAEKSRTVAVATHDKQVFVNLNQCYIVGTWPQSRRAIARRRKELLEGLKSTAVTKAA